MTNTTVAILAILVISLASIFAVGYWKAVAQELTIASAAISGLIGFIGGTEVGKMMKKEPKENSGETK